MAKTGSIGITLNSQSIANNTSTITVKGTITTSGDSYRGSHRTGTYTVKQGSTVIYNGTFTNGAPANTTTTLFSKTLVVTHDVVGKSGDISVSYNYDDGWCTASGSAGLPTIPRKSELTVANGTLGTAQTLTVTMKSTTFTHTITATCGDQSETIASKSTATSISFTPPLDFATENTTGTSVSVKYTITTYNGSTSIGSDSYTKTCSIPTSVKPTVSFTVADENGYASTYGGYVQGKSAFNIAITASGSYGSTISSYKTTVDGKTYADSSFATPAISGSGTLTITVTVTDSRGRTATATKEVTVFEYENPQITSLKVQRCDASGSASSSGAYLKITFSSSISSVNSKNGCSYVLDYKKKSVSSYTSVELTNYAGNLVVTDGTHIIPAETSSSYDLILRVADSFVAVQKQTTGSSASKLWSILAKGKGIAFGKVAELANTIDFGFETLFRRKNVFSNASFGQTIIERSGSSNGAAIGFQNADGVLGYVGMLTEEGNTLVKWSADTESHCNVLDADNYNQYALPLTGGTMNGQVFFNKNIALKNNVWLQAANTSGAYRNMAIINSSGEYIFGYGSYQHSEGSAYYDGNNTYIRAKTQITQRIPSGDLIFTTDRLRTSVDDTYYLGDSARRWKSVYAITGTIQTSDRNKKDNIVKIDDKYEALFNQLQPVTFELKGSKHDRTHVGFIAQDVEESLSNVGLTATDFAGFCKEVRTEEDEETGEIRNVLDENGNLIYDYALRYGEFIALNTHMIQKANTKIEAQQAEIDLLKTELETIKSKL